MSVDQMKGNGHTLLKSRSKQYPTESITDADYVDTITPAQAEFLQQRLKQAVRGYVYSDKTKFICFKQDGTISSLNSKPLKSVDQVIYLGSNILSTKSNINICIDKDWIAIDWGSTIWKSDLSDSMKSKIFQTVAVLVLLYSCTLGLEQNIWTKS